MKNAEAAISSRREGGEVGVKYLRTGGAVGLKKFRTEEGVTYWGGGGTFAAGGQYPITCYNLIEPALF